MNEYAVKVVIADDELHICRLIQALIDWNGIGLKLMGTASNGMEALEEVRTKQPDILITDIRMPGCSGLELIKGAKEVLPDLQILIVSGYAHFEYAKQAIQYGVGDYLLKPVNKKELNDTLLRMAEKCHKAKYVEDSILKAHQNSMDDILRLRRSLISDLIDRKNLELSSESLIRTYHFNSSDGLFQTIELKIDYDENEPNMNTRRVIYEKTQQSFSSALSGVCIDNLMAFRQMAGFALLHFSADSKENIRKALRDALHLAEEQGRALGSFYYTLAVGKDVSSAKDIPFSFAGLSKLITERLVQGTGIMLDGEYAPSGIREDEMLDHYSSVIDKEIETMDLKLADEAVDALSHAIMASENIRGYEIFSAVQRAGRIFIMKAGKNPSDEIYTEFYESCTNSSRPEMLFSKLRELHHSVIADRISETENDAARPVRLAKQYICSHYAEQITLEDVSSVIGFSVSYFSALFKKENGDGFAKYLTKIRIDEAKTLLRETDIPVSMIGEQVGYLDRKYFTQTFHKTVGLNPGEYRKLYG